eukprot:5291495-Lingulodinium_polyedra.AAC.1
MPTIVYNRPRRPRICGSNSRCTRSGPRPLLICSLRKEARHGLKGGGSNALLPERIQCRSS